MDRNYRFFNKHVLITGAARGIGFEIAMHFAREGAVLSLIDNNKENLANAFEKLSVDGKQVYIYEVDVSSLNEVKSAVSLIDDKQSIDVLINNAGIAMETPFFEITENEWRRILDTNLNGMFFMAQCVCKLMAKRGKGTVVNMASKNGLDGEFGYAHYNASKGGVIMLTKTMALELAHLGIRVNAVCPGYIQTPMSKEIDPPEFTANFVNQYIPLNRPGTPEEIAPVFLFLASEESSFITGQIIIADGGQLAGQKPGIELLKNNRYHNGAS
jgi:3-oxoacyl-[acyl-carrier protein] reductase